MSGIAGYVNWSGEPIDRDRLRRMIDVIRHRGPDDEGFFVDGNVGLGHARLSIIDVAGGKQPMANADGTLWITFNGKIFNCAELRRGLERRGHRFTARSDAEVVLHAYEEKGGCCVASFNGQWAFAIWDARNRRLFLSRDRMGVRPLFYTTTGGSFMFGSEIKSLFRHPGVRRELDLRSLDQTFTFWTPLAPHTPFRDVSELPPGHSMTVTAASSRVERYWMPEYRWRDTPAPCEQQYVEQLTELLSDATRIRLRGEAPVGAYVSGGLDSTVITTLVKCCCDTPLKIFSVTFDDPEFDESSYQQEVVRVLASEHHELRCTYEDIGRVFPKVVWHAEKPILRTAPAPLFLLSALVRQHGCNVVLTGDGADEMFGGYDIFKEAKIRRFWAMQPDSRRRPLLLKRLYPYLPQLQSQSTDYLRAFFGVRPEDSASPFFSHLPRWNMTSGLKRFLSADVRAYLADYDAYSDLRSTLPDDYWRWDSFSQALYLETSALLPGFILSSQGDRAAMANAVEGRFPFLDHRIVRFAGRLPPRLKMKVLDEKYLLKRSFRNVIPESVRLRKKQPHRAPAAKSFFGSRACPSRHDYVGELLSVERLRDYGVFSPDAVQRLVGKARAGRIGATSDSMALVGILSTQLLVHQFIRSFE